ncbi:MAG: universal stress protein [bacterium]|nr:universal stress protein [bacterium]
MKTILATSDFSPASLNAARYAAELAAKAGAKLILLHVYHPPVMVSEGYIVTPSLDEMKEDSNARLKLICDKLQSEQEGKLDLEFQSKVGLAADEIDLFAKEKQVDLVIMGMQSSSKMAEKLFGSTTTSFLSRTLCTTLSIQQDVKFKDVKKIAYASDYKEYHTNLPEILRDLIKLWGASIHILHVFPEQGEIPSYNEAIAGIKLEQQLQGIEHTFHAIVNKDVVQGINDYITANKSDMVVMTPRKHSFIESLFKEPNTKRMAFHSNIPLLTIH